MSSSNDQFHIPPSQRNTGGVSEMIPSDMKLYIKGAVLSFHNISYRVKTKSGFMLGKKTVEKDILSNIRYVFHLYFVDLHLNYMFYILPLMCCEHLCPCICTNI